MYKAVCTGDTILMHPDGKKQFLAVGEEFKGTREQLFELRQARKCAFLEAVPEHDGQDAKEFGPHEKEAEGANKRKASQEKAKAKAGE